MADPVRPDAPPSPTGGLGEQPTPAEWRAAMGYFPSGVTIVTTWDGEAPVGSTVSSFCSLSLDPPLLLVCLGRANPILAPLKQCGVFGVNILREDGHQLARWFGAPAQADRLDPSHYRPGARAAPQLEAAPVFIECTLEAAHDGGDHVIVVGRGARIEHTSSAPPLLYHKGGFLTLVSPN
jgi:3-hydroxy-9,10-secoandrosta-1,3,5(10)-triene-9,17-dione monooxygenase reductase component